MPTRSSARITQAIIFAVVFLIMSLQMASGQGLPARAFDVEGGSIQMQGGILASKQRGFFGAKDEIALFLILTNEGKIPVWAKVEFQSLGADKVSREIKMIKGGDQAIYKETMKQVVWDTEHPFKATIFSDEEQKIIIGSETTSFYFEEKEKQYLEELQGKLKPNQASIISGFRELTHKSMESEVDGTSADPGLQRDIKWSIFKAESKLHKDCEHHILKAEAYGTTKSVISAKIGGEAQRLEEKLRSKGDMIIEKWWVQGCGTVSSYEVLLLRSPQGGTDIIIEKLGAEPAEK